MNGLLLGEIAWSWDRFVELYAQGGGDYSWLKPLLSAITIVLWVALAIVGAAGALYAVYVGVKMARADSAEAREENKKRLINIIVSIVVTIVLIIFFQIFLPAILSAFHDYQPQTEEGTGEALRLLLHM